MKEKEKHEVECGIRLKRKAFLILTVSARKNWESRRHYQERKRQLQEKISFHPQLNLDMFLFLFFSTRQASRPPVSSSADPSVGNRPPRLR